MSAYVFPMGDDLTFYTAAEVADLLRLHLQVVQRKLQAGEMPNLEAALVKDLGNAFERAIPELARLLPPARRGMAPDPFEAVLAETVLHAPSWTLRGGTTEILRGIIARGLGLR